MWWHTQAQGIEAITPNLLSRRLKYPLQVKMSPMPLKGCNKSAEDAATAAAQNANVAEQGVIIDQPEAVKTVITAQPGAVQDDLVAQPAAAQHDLIAQPNDGQDDSHGVVKLHAPHQMGDVAETRGNAVCSPSSIKAGSPDDVKELIDAIVAAQKSVGVWA